MFGGVSSGKKRGRKVQDFDVYYQKTTDRIKELRAVIEARDTPDEKKKQLRN